MSQQTNALLRKWHYIGGLFTLPVVIVLAVTGLIYLCKDYYEAPQRAELRTVSSVGEGLSLSEQLKIATANWQRPVQALILPTNPNEATEFTSGRFGGKASVFVNPYTGEITGKQAVNATDMYQVRKLHGELLTGSFGTKIVELVGSWLVVLILSGLVLFWPRWRRDWSALLQIWRGNTSRLRWQFMHAVLGFWSSVFLLLILAGGLPWTDVWGGGFKKVQQLTATGYPPAWRGIGLKSSPQETDFTLDQAADFARMQLQGDEVKISLPKGPEGVYGIQNTNYANQKAQRSIYLDQYSGEVLSDVPWSEVGILMRGRMWAMAFHQGQLGTWNWVLVFVVTLLLLFLSLAAVFAYRSRSKPVRHPKISYPTWMIGLIVFLSVLLPLFGASVVLIVLYEYVASRRLA